MRIRNILNSRECKSLFEEVQLFVEKSLSEYNESISVDGFRYIDKDIFDFVWGTIDFSAAEICILDSPLLQRLRRIRQLGLASTVYCNADSSRFSHTIGVTEVASRMAKVVSEKVRDVLNSDEFNEFKIYNTEEVVRLAAIFHDTGHMFYSHVSELFFSFDRSFPRYREITRARTYFCEKTSAEVSLHELLSVMIVNSPATLKLIELVAPHMKKSRLTEISHYEQLAEFISSLIIGTPTNKYILPYSTIINSAIDADKFDYLLRDSQCTKVPIAVDIARIIRKLDVVNIESIEQTAIWDDSTSTAVPLKVMAIKNSARNVFFQLSNARSSMYESVYYHHKVLTAETMFRDALRKLYMLKASDKISFCDILELTDDSFNDHWEYALLNEGEINTQEKENISNCLKWVRNRNLYKRVAAFSQDIICAPKAAKEDFLNVVVQDPLSEDFKRFCSRLQEEYAIVCKFLEIQPKNNPTFMFIYSKYDAMSSVPVERGDGYCIWSSKLMKQDTIEAGKKSKQEQFYLVTDCKDRIPVYLALEKVLTEFDITGLTTEASICSKLSQSSINRARLSLFEKDYYQNVLYILQDEFLREKVFDKHLFSKILDKYRSFMGVNNCRITEESLLKYLRQFLYLQIKYEEVSILLNGILQVLNTAFYLDRDSFVEQLSCLLGGKIGQIECDRKHVVFLGGLFDSANHWLYFFNDVKGRDTLLFEKSIEGALKSAGENDCICFFDDGAYSGKQVISIFQELMGVPSEERTTNEHHVDELKDEEKLRLKKSNIVLAYLCFNSHSEEYIRSELRKIGIENLKIYYNYDLSTKLFDNSGNTFFDEKQKVVVESYLRIIGQSILESTKKMPNGNYKDRWSKERVEGSALGYNDAQQAVIFYNNIPTYSLTALWANGVINGSKWSGLFQRTNKD